MPVRNPSHHDSAQVRDTDRRSIYRNHTFRTRGVSVANVVGVARSHAHRNLEGHIYHVYRTRRISRHGDIDRRMTRYHIFGDRRMACCNVLGDPVLGDREERRVSSRRRAQTAVERARRSRHARRNNTRDRLHGRDVSCRRPARALFR